MFLQKKKKNLNFPKGDFKKIYITVLEKTLKALDPSIEKVEELNDIDDSYVIRMKSKNVIIQEGSIVNESILSSGTKAGLEIARIVGSILTNEKSVLLL